MMNKFIKDTQNSMKWSNHQNQSTIDLTLAQIDFGLYKPFQQSLQNQLTTLTLNTSTLSPNQTTQQSKNTIQQWYKTYHKINLQPQTIIFTSSVATLCSCVILASTQKQQKVMIFTPVYTYYHNAIWVLGREVVTVGLGYYEGEFQIDWEEFQRKIKECRLLIVSQPHNPSGRIWRYDQMERMVAACRKYDVCIFSDEILGDMALISNGKQFNSILKYQYTNIVMGNSLSKSFNAASLQTAYAITPSKTLLQTLQTELLKYYGNPSSPNFLAACYYKTCLSLEGYQWLNQINTIFRQNYTKLKNLQLRLPQLIVGGLDSGYLVWMDFSGYERKFGIEQLKRVFENRRVYVSFMEGYYYPVKRTYEVRVAIAVETHVFDQFLVRLVQILDNPTPSL